MKLLHVCFTNEILRNANVIHILLVAKWFHQFFTQSKIYKVINQSHEFYNTLIVFIIANDGQTDT